MVKINKEEYWFLRGLDDSWKWLARDEDLSVYDDKPVKVHSVIPCWDIRTANNDWQRINRSLFPFVQWGDEEPYSIGELIDEYEKESEETEVKKDLEWVKHQLDLRDTGTIDKDDPQFYVDSGLRMALDFLDQLDEPEQPVELQELIEKYSKDSMSTYDVKVEREKFVNDLKKLLVTKQELPEIPKFVADWIEEAKDRKLTLYGAINECPREVDYWLVDGDSSNQETLARAWLDGFTAEKEQQYFARIKGWENVTTGSEAYYWVDFKKGDGGVGISTAVEDEYQSVSFTKHDWNNLGINEYNADFVLVEEL